jgi:AcrR family transcriptional regulator
MRGVPSRGRGTSRRQTSERALLDSFEALLQRHGPGGLGVNAVLDSAGVGKRLLYEYFGDLEGLAAAWSRERSDPLALDGRRDALLRKLAPLAPVEGIAGALSDYADELRRHPWAAQVLLAELSQPATLGRAMREIRLELGKGYEGLLVESGAFGAREGAQIGFVLHAAATYLAMRARFAPDYNGIDLSTPQGWAAAMDAFAAIGRLAAARRPRHGAAGRRKRPAPARGATKRKPSPGPRAPRAAVRKAKRARPAPPEA